MSESHDIVDVSENSFEELTLIDVDSVKAMSVVGLRHQPHKTISFTIKEHVNRLIRLLMK